MNLPCAGIWQHVGSFSGCHGGWENAQHLEPEAGMLKVLLCVRYAVPSANRPTSSRVLLKIGFGVLSLVNIALTYLTVKAEKVER